MRIARLALIAGLLVLLALPTMAQMDQNQANQNQTNQYQNQNQMNQGQAGQQSYHATVQSGPRVRAGLPQSADVMINGTLAMRIPASAGGKTPMQRAQTIADRLNQAFASGASWQSAQVMQQSGLWTVNIGNNLIATADLNSARAFGVQTGQLASRWARQSVVAMGGQPQMIAQQLQPVAVAVAGAQQELGGAWTTANTRSVAAFDTASGQNIGNVVVAGQQNNLSRVNSVAVYSYDTDNANAYVFAPSTSATITGTNVPRAATVGVVSIPDNLIDMTAIQTGADATQMFNEMSPSQWNAALNNQLASWRIPLNASSKVVPLYSMDTNQVIGAAQIVGNANAIGQAQSVTARDVSGNLRFSVTSMAPNMISGQPNALNGAVVSAIIVFPGTAAAPAGEMAPEAGETPTP